MGIVVIVESRSAISLMPYLLSGGGGEGGPPLSCHGWECCVQHIFWRCVLCVCFPLSPLFTKIAANNNFPLPLR